MNAKQKLPMGIVSPRSRILRVVLAFLMVGTAGFGLQAAPRKAPPLKAPAVLKGDFVYIETDKGKNKNFDWERYDRVELHAVECRLTSDAGASANLVQYMITKLNWHAVGNGRETSLSDQGCTYKADENAEGSGTETASFPMSMPGGLIWYPKDNRFELSFSTNSDKGHWKKVYHPCHPGDTQVAELTKSWNVFIKGVVDYNPKTKTYRFLTFTDYKKPVEPGGETNVMVHAEGEARGTAK